MKRPHGRALGLIVGLALVAVGTAALLPARGDVTTATPALVFVAPALIAALLGGRLAGVVTAAAAAVALDVGFIEPYGTLDVHVVDDLVAVAVFGAVALTMATLVAEANDRRRAAEARAREILTLSEERERSRRRQAQLTADKMALQQAEDARRALLRSVSHDLRTPLASIRAITSDLRAGTVYDEATRRDLLDVVGDEAERLDRLVANLLSLSRIEAGALVPDVQAVDLAELIGDRVRRSARLLRDVRLETDLPDLVPLVDADYVLIDQLVTNLLENAVRHSPPDSPVRVEAVDRGETVEVAVSDAGPGVPSADRGVIFEPFRTGSDGGGTSGVGLAICKAITEAHGGRIAVDDAPEGGARFTFTLPAHHVRPQVPEGVRR